MPVVSLVERDGKARSFHVANVTGETLRPILTKHVNAKTRLATDESSVYLHTGKEVAAHAKVNHTAGEYVKDNGVDHTKTIESSFALMKRAVFGTHHSISEAHLPRYLAEWDFKWNTRKINDGERAALIAKGIEGKRLTYRPLD